ncbi:WD40 repeat domain-containing serine/threonine protein kinase [Streptomyces sp. NPDC056721]|uniref:WD40 repeat domain-containing serine/threonine protein kinase n=1 Tax=unclassified Streptomyces TaxID=2593676 RepID=UPI0036AE2D21
MESLQPGDPRRIGSYQLEGRLGAGGMGQVFLGASPGGRKVAVKLIRPEFARNPQFRRRFVLEVEAARKVGGFHTAQVVDADTTADPPWLVTAFIDGHSLQDVVSTQGPLAPAEVAALAAGLAEGLIAIHNCGLVHRDLKPSNVIMASDGPRIIDFGVAQVTDAGAATSTGIVVGTFSFMSPEQIRADQAGSASDVFALGCVLTFAATGSSPFAAATLPATTHRILSQPPQLDGVTGTLRGLIDSCLAKEPLDRPDPANILALLSPPRTVVDLSTARTASRQPSAAAMADLSTETRLPSPLVPSPDQPPPRFTASTGEDADRKPTPRPRRGIRRRTLVLGALAIASAGAGTAAAMLWPDDNVVKLTGENTQFVAFSTGSNMLAASSYNPDTQDEHIWLWNTATGDSIAKLADQDFVTGVKFSPDGKTLGTSSKARDGGAGGVWLRDAATGVTTTKLTGEEAFSIAFSADGTTVAGNIASAQGDNNRIPLWDTTTGNATAAFGLSDHDSVNGLAFSPDGKSIAVASNSSSWLLDLSTGRTIATLFNERTFAVAFNADGKILATAGESGVRLWNGKVGKPVRTLTADKTQSVAFDPHDTTLVTGGAGGVRLWDGTTGRAISTLTGNGAAAVAFSPNGKRVAVGSEGGCWQWKLH